MVKKKFLLLLLIVFAGNLLAQHGLSGTDTDWWNWPNFSYYDNDAVRTDMSFISVKDNHFVNEDGKRVDFMGVNVADPTKLEKYDKLTKEHFQEIKNWGGNLVRIPIHPIAWKKKGDAEYFKLLDKIIEWASELKIYLIFEWHSIGNLKVGLFQHPMHETSMQETFNFWRKIAQRYKGIPALAFYEIFNEPTRYGGQLGKITWDEWRIINEDIIDIIFAQDSTVIPLVGGFNWAYELRSVINNPVQRKGIGYVTHPYPMKVEKPWELKWEVDWGHVANVYPVIATELGYMHADDPGAHIPCISDSSYAIAITNYLHKKGMSFTAWCFDPHWPPQMIKDYDYTPTEFGDFFRNVMLGKYKYPEE